MQRFLAPILFIILLPVTFITSGTQIDDILHKHAGSVGSLQQWQEPDALAVNICIKEPGFTVTAIYYVTRQGNMRIDIFDGEKHVFTEGYNGQVAWQWHPELTMAKLITGQAAANLINGVTLPGKLFTLIDMPLQGHRLEYVGREQRQSGQGEVIKLTLTNGHQKYYVLDGQSGQLIASRDQRAFHPDLDDTEVLIETRYSDYRTVNGTRRAFKSENIDLTNNKWLGTTTIKSFEFNPEIAADFFDPETFNPNKS